MSATDGLHSAAVRSSNFSTSTNLTPIAGDEHPLEPDAVELVIPKPHVP
jgi:hypothetical protein